MKGYTLISTCRICSKVDQDTRDAIDADLISGETTQTILLRYKDKFPFEHPLTENSIANHKKHLMEWLATSHLSAIKTEAGKLTLVPEVIERSHEIDKFLAKQSLEVARGIVNHDEMLQALIIDSFRDIERIQEELTSSVTSPKYMRMMILTKDQVKKTLIDTLQRSQELRQKVGGDLERVAAVKEALTRSIQCCIKALRGLKVTQEEADQFAALLKDAMMKDSVISKYLEDVD